MRNKVVTLKPNATEDQQRLWAHAVNRGLLLLENGNDLDKMKKLAKEAIKKYALDQKDRDNADEVVDKLTNVISDNDGRNDNTDGDGTTTVAIKGASRIVPVTVKFNSGSASTSWDVDFDLAQPQRLDQRGYVELLYKMVEGHVLYDEDRKIFWIYDSKRWVPVDKHSSAMRKFSLQSVDIFISNTIASTNTLTYNVQTGFSLMMAKPVKSDSQSEKDYKSDLADYKRMQNVTKQYNYFLSLIQRNTTIKQSFEDLKALLSKSNIRWDDDDYLLNVKNGVVDLKNGKLVPHNKNYYMTRICPVDYKPGQPHPVLDKTLSISFPGDDGDEVKSYLQRQAGYFLVGGNRDEHLFMWFGPKARNGKSVLANTFGRILGSELTDKSGYAITVPVETFLSSKFGEDGKQADPNLANLQGTRLAIASEPNRSAKLNGGKIKLLTGDRMITARHLNQDPTTFMAKFKILILCNFLPSSDGDASIKRRVNILHFDHHIKSGSLEDNPEALDQLWEEKEGILNWMVQGAIQNEKTRQHRIAEKKKLTEEVQKKGLSLEDVDPIYEDVLMPLPQSVSEAIDSYIYSSNSVSQFLHETVVSKHEYWKYLFYTVFAKYDKDSHYDAYDSNSNGDKRLKFDRHYFTEQKLLCLPNGYTLRTNLYKMYRNYCAQTGIVHPVSANSFYDMANRYLTPARTNKGRVYIGIVPTPLAGDANTHDYELKNWVESASDFKAWIYSIGGDIQRKDKVTSNFLQEEYKKLHITSTDTCSVKQTKNLSSQIQENPDLYFGRMTGTLNPSSIDFEDEAKELNQKRLLIDPSTEIVDDDNQDNFEDIFN